MTKENSNKGFSIVELSMVILIIGVLGAVALHQFRSYKARAMVTEAKILLATLYSVEKIFHNENNFYSNCLGHMGFIDSLNEKKPWYSIGFPNITSSIDVGAYVSSGQTSFISSRCPAVLAPKDGKTYFLGKPGGSNISTIEDFTAVTTDDSLGTQSGPGEYYYKAVAASRLPVGLFTQWNESILTVDENKKIEIIKSGFN